MSPTQSYKDTRTTSHDNVSQAPYSPTYSVNLGQKNYAQPHLVDRPAGLCDRNTSRLDFATPTKATQEDPWRHTNAHRVSFPVSSPRGGTWSSSIKSYYERESIKTASADDPGLMTQYYGTQQTCIARYLPQSHQYEQKQHIRLHDQYHQDDWWNSAGPQKPLATSSITYQPQGPSFYNLQEQKKQVVQCQPQQHQSFISGT
ncbi:unnamed protein product [Mesocestoides corti]|uniref:Uncharacterized protein n=1 Tax=Mesocestoides corti TaxID=53468 RepID=A0A0R3UPD3_MESCO|nr:unnamed protein product [Mesocestoides corti]